MRRRPLPTTLWSGLLCAVLCLSSTHSRLSAVDFVRGDCNADGIPGVGGDLCDLADPIFLLRVLFLGGPRPACPEACNVNDDARLDLADAVYQLAYCFLGRREPPPPFPRCGPDPTGPSLGCVRFEPCAGPSSPCVPQRARGEGDGDAVFGWAYTGRHCVLIAGSECVGPDCDSLYDSFEECERATRDCPPRCLPMDARGEGPCDAVLGVVFDGERCRDFSGCECVGEDCDQVFDSIEECEAVHVGCIDPCDAMDIEGVGFCRVVLGWYYDGAGCQPLSACECVGEDCVFLYEGPEECERATADCRGPCDAQDARGEGLCERFFGYAWNGSECVGISGCECLGEDCDELFQDPEECARAFRDCDDPCAPQDARGEGLCAAFFGYAWNGSECVGISGCDCVGEDCDETFDTPEECAAAHADCPRPCAPQRARGAGDCEAILGVAWNGRECVSLVGCECVGDDCDDLFDSIDECERAFGDCIDLCAPQDARGEGPCEAFFGYAWDGRDCVGLSGCECVGEDCDETFDSVEECRRAHRPCPPTCDEMDAKGEGPCDAFFGYTWNGRECVGVSGCECVGEDCDELFDSIEECNTSFARCMDPCDAQDAVGEGPCRQILGVAWNGTECVGVTGCECIGEDCDELFDSVDECERSQADCPGPCDPMRVRPEGLCEAILGWYWDGDSCEPLVGCDCIGPDCDRLYPSLAACREAHRRCIAVPADE